MSSKESCDCKLDIDQCSCSADTSPEDYYDVLFLNNDCHFFDIEKAFKVLAEKYNENDSTKTHIKDCEFAKMKTAFEVLSNPLTRLIYDNFGLEGLKTRIPEPYGWAEDFLLDEEEEIDNLPSGKESSRLEECQKPRNKLSKEKNITKDLYLTLEEILYGGLKKISVIKHVLTDDCNCEKMYERKIVPVYIKPGLPTNSKIVFVEEGHEAPCKIAGDIILTTRDKPHKIFHRDGSNLLMSVDVNIQEALLGKNITIDTIDKRKIRVNITSIITPDYKKIVSGEGLPIPTNPNERGDLIISFQIAFPLYLSAPVKSEIERIFTGASQNIAKIDNEYIHRSILDEKMRKMGEQPDLTKI